MECNNCGLEFNEADLTQVLAHEHHIQTSLDKVRIGRKVTHNVESILFKNTVLFSGLEWECKEFIDNKFGNGFKSLMHKIVRI